MLQVPACPAVPQLPHWLMINACSACLPLLPQVFELSAAIDSTLVWQEVCLLAQCRHERIVPLLGVAIEVRRCCWLLLAWPLCHLHVALAAAAVVQKAGRVSPLQCHHLVPARPAMPCSAVLPCRAKH